MNKPEKFWIRKHKMSNANMVVFKSKPSLLGMSWERIHVIEKSAYVDALNHIQAIHTGDPGIVNAYIVEKLRELDESES